MGLGNTEFSHLSSLGPLNVLVCLDLHFKALAHDVLCSCVVPVLLSLPQTQAQANLHPSLDGLCYACSRTKAFVVASPVLLLLHDRSDRTLLVPQAITSEAGNETSHAESCMGCICQGGMGAGRRTRFVSS